MPASLRDSKAALVVVPRIYARAGVLFARMFAPFATAVPGIRNIAVEPTP
jgi:hypothetical protein